MFFSRLLTYFFLSSLVFLMFFHQITALNQDLGRHILLGKIITQTLSVPLTNLLSYTNPDFSFINTHWLSEVIFYLVEKLTGFLGLLIFTSLFATAAFLIQLLYIKKYKFLPIVLASLIYLQILLDRTDVRPEIFSFFFLSIFVVILYKYRNRFTKWIYLLPIIEMLWVNIHIYFPVGIIVIGLFLLDHILTQRKRIKSKQTLTLVVVLLLCFVATMINPNTIRGALNPLFLFNNYGFEIEENHNIFDIWNLYQQKSAIAYFFISVPLLFSLLFLNFKKTKPIDWFLAIAFSIIAASAERNLPLFVFTTFIAFAGALNNLYTNLHLQLQKNIYLSYLIYSLFGLFIIWQTTSMLLANPLGFGLPTNQSNAVDFLRQINSKGPIFNNFDTGSYLAYRLYPGEKVFVDGRPEAYPASFFKNEYIPVEQNKNLFQQEDNKYHFNVIFISYTDVTPWNQQFLREINANPKWRLVYLNPLVVIYIKNSLQNQHITNTSILNSAKLAPLNLTKDDLNHLLVFYENIGWTNEIKTVDQKLLALDPNSCFALSNLATLMTNENDSGYIVYASRYQSMCH
jgi:hypothetical protein